MLGRGRFGLVFRATDAATGQEAVVRTFTSVAPASAAGLAESLAWLCEQPLDHPSVARPLAAGVKGDVPYLVHAYLPGRSLDSWLDEYGPLTAADALPRLTQVAAALDFAAAVGVHHGLLSLQDVIVSEERSGITGLGLAQAMAMAGLPAPHAGDDMRALALIASVMLGRPVRGPVAEVLASGLAYGAGDTPGGALRFVARLQEAADDEEAAAAATSTPVPPPVVASRRSPAPYWVAAAALVVGLLTGFAGGFFAGQRENDAAPVPDVTGTRGYSEAPVEPRATVVEDPPVVVPPEAVDQPPTVERPAEDSRPARGDATADGIAAPPAAPPAARPDAPAAPAPTVREPQGLRGPGRLNVVSRPAGAQVYVDERLVGTTPLALADVAPGAHRVRIALPEHRPWVTDVVVRPGEAARVAASLEQ